MRKRSKTAARKTQQHARLRQPRSADDLFSMTNDAQDMWERVIEVVAAMRSEGKSLQQATRDAGISPSRALRLAGSAIRQRSGGRYVAAASDSLLRVVVIPTTDGLTEVALRNSKDATRVAEYLNAVHRYLSKGDASALSTFRDVAIRSVEGERLTLVTDGVTLDRLGSAGVLSFESIYAGGGR